MAVVSGAKCSCGKGGGKVLTSVEREYTWGVRKSTRLLCKCGQVRFKMEDKQPEVEESTNE